MEYSATPHDLLNGYKLTEHSYIGNNYVNLFISRLANKAARVIWAGDYNDNDTINGEQAQEFLDKHLSDPTKEPIVTYRYVINHDKKQYVDLEKCRENKYGCAIHPLPLLTASRSNGRGSGDYPTNGIGANFIGTWAYDVISVADELPKKGEWKEIVPDFMEDR